MDEFSLENYRFVESAAQGPNLSIVIYKDDRVIYAF
jgi:hypothetical protein